MWREGLDIYVENNLIDDDDFMRHFDAAVVEVVVLEVVCMYVLVPFT